MACSLPRDPARLIESFSIRCADGVNLIGFLYSFPARKGGRRIVVEDETHTIVYDTDEQFDLANATNRLDLWLAEQHPAAVHALWPEVRCDHCGTTLASIGNPAAEAVVCDGTTLVCEPCARKASAPIPGTTPTPEACPF